MLCCTVLCKSNVNVFCRNSWLFLAFRQKNIEFSMEANFQRKVTIIRDAYCFQLREFSNDNSLGTKIYFEFSSDNLQCSINDLEHLSEILLFVCSARTSPRIFWTIICPVRICQDDSFLMSLHSVSFTTNSFPFIQQFYTRLTYSTSKVPFTVYFTLKASQLLHHCSLVVSWLTFVNHKGHSLTRPCLRNPDSARTRFLYYHSNHLC